MTTKRAALPKTLSVNGTILMGDDGVPLISVLRTQAQRNAYRQEMAKRWNAHDELLAALEDLLAFVKRGTYDPKQVPNAEAAIQKARGE